MFYCPLPFISHSFDAGLRRRLCCHDETDQLSGIELTQERLNEIRVQISNGEVPDNCKGCYEQEKSVGHSPRTFYLEHFEKSFSTNEIKYLDITIDNKCNLECTTCSPEYSNRLQSLYQKINLDFPRNDVNEEVFLEKISKIKSELKANLSDDAEILITGGEPSISKEAALFIKWLVEEFDTKDMKLKFFTNLTQGVNWLDDYFALFKSIHLEVSLDATGDLLEYIRYPSNWDTIKENLKLLVDYSKSKNVNFSIHTVYSSLNFWTIAEFVLELQQIAEIPQLVPVITKLEGPRIFNITNLPNKVVSKYRYQGLDTLSKYRDESENLELRKRLSEVIAFIKNIEIDNDNDLLIELRTFLSRTDKFKEKKHKDVIIYI